MIPMTKNGTVKYVPDIFVESYRRDGYAVFGEKAVEAAPSLPAVEEIAEEEVDNNIDGAEEKAVEAAPSLPAVEEIAEEEVDNNIDGAEEKAVEAAPSLPAEEKADGDEPKQSKFTCPVCGKEYAKKAYLDRHIAEKHS